MYRTIILSIILELMCTMITRRKACGIEREESKVGVYDICRLFFYIESPEES